MFIRALLCIRVIKSVLIATTFLIITQDITSLTFRTQNIIRESIFISFAVINFFRAHIFIAVPIVSRKTTMFVVQIRNGWLTFKTFNCRIIFVFQTVSTISSNALLDGSIPYSLFRATVVIDFVSIRITLIAN